MGCASSKEGAENPRSQKQSLRPSNSSEKNLSDGPNTHISAENSGQEEAVLTRLNSESRRKGDGPPAPVGEAQNSPHQSSFSRTDPQGSHVHTTQSPESKPSSEDEDATEMERMIFDTQVEENVDKSSEPTGAPHESHINPDNYGSKNLLAELPSESYLREQRQARENERHRYNQTQMQNYSARSPVRLDPSDPWSSLQTAYRPITPLENSEKLYHPRNPARNKTKGNLGDEEEEAVLLEEDLDSAIKGRAKHFITENAPDTKSPKKGSWGQGDLARPGTLMVGSTPLDAPDDGCCVQPLSSGRDVDEQAVMPHIPDHDDPKRKPEARGAQVDDVNIEDLENIDDILVSHEPEGPPKNNLAAKLAAFESSCAEA